MSLIEMTDSVFSGMFSTLMSSMISVLRNIACTFIFVCLYFSVLGPSPSQKKTSFHKIVRKHKYLKEKPGAVENCDLKS